MGSSFDPTGMRGRKNVMTLEDGRETIGLNRRADLVAAELDILQHDGMESGILKLGDVS